MLPLLTTRGAVMAFSITNRQNAFELAFVSGVAHVFGIIETQYFHYLLMSLYAFPLMS